MDEGNHDTLIILKTKIEGIEKDIGWIKEKIETVIQLEARFNDHVQNHRSHELKTMAAIGALATIIAAVISLLA